MALSFAPGDAYQFGCSHDQVEIGGPPQTVKVAHLRLCHSGRFYIRDDGEGLVISRDPFGEGLRVQVGRLVLVRRMQGAGYQDASRHGGAARHVYSWCRHPYAFLFATPELEAETPLMHRPYVTSRVKLLAALDWIWAQT